MADPRGGPAFPVQEFIVGFDEKPPVMAGTFYPGMTLRDYFAAKAMQAVQMPQSALHDIPAAYDRIASHAYKLADAMLKARQS